MADKTGTIRITASTELGELQKLNTAIDNMQANFMKATVGATSLSGVVANLASQVSSKLVAALHDAVVNLDKFIQAGDDFNDTVGANRESVWRMTQESQHMAEAMDVVRFRARLMASEGIKPTEKDLDDLTRAASNLAHKTKTDWITAADALTKVWQGASDKGIKPLNFEIDKNTNLVGRQVQILEQAAKLGKVRLSQAAEEKALLKEKNDAYLHLSSVMNDNDIIARVMNFRQIDRVKNEIAWVKSLEEGWKKVRPYLVTFAPQFEPKETSFLGKPFAGGFGVDEGSIEKADIIEPKTEFGAKKGPKGPQTAIWKQNTSKAQSDLRQWIDKILGEKESRERKQFDLGSEARDRQIDYESQKALERQLEANKKAMDALDEFDRGQARAVESTRRFNQELQDLAMGGLKSVYGGLLDLADAAVQGQDGIGKMALNMLKAITMGLSQQLFAMGLAASIEAAGYTAGVVTAPMAIPASAKAAIFFAGATTLAGLGLGMSAASAGMSGGRGGGGASAASSGANYRPNFGTKTSSKDLPPIVVRVTFDRSDPASVEFARRKVKAELVAAGYSEDA